MPRHIALALVALAGVTFPAAKSFGHRFDPQRSLVIQIDDQGLVALWRFELRGNQADLVLAMTDLNRDGTLSQEEASAAAAVLLGKARRGITLTLDGQRLFATGSDARLEGRPAAGAPLVMVALAPLSEPTTCGPHRIEVEVDPRTGPLLLQTQTRAPARTLGVGPGALPSDSRGLTIPVTLGGDDRFWFDYEG